VTKPVRLDEVAEQEVLDAKRWYENERAGLSDELLADLAATLESVERHPNASPRVEGVGEACVRSARLRRFPYRVVYMELPDRWRVVAFAHVRRHPDYWKGRLAPP
jgi:toxin ParE1/3/4